MWWGGLVGVVVLTVGLAACGDDEETSTTETSAETTAASTAPATTAPAAGDEITIDPADPQLLGYELGAGSDEVVAGVTAALGEPTSDPGAVDSECGPFARERAVAWGDLVASFDASGGDEVFAGWIFDPSVGRPGGPSTDDVGLSEGLTWSSTYNEVFNAFADPVPTVDESTVGTLVVVGPVTFGFPVDAADDAPLERAWVGTIPICS